MRAASEKAHALGGAIGPFLNVEPGADGLARPDIPAVVPAGAQCRAVHIGDAGACECRAEFHARQRAARLRGKDMVQAATERAGKRVMTEDGHARRWPMAASPAPGKAARRPVRSLCSSASIRRRARIPMVWLKTIEMAVSRGSARSTPQGTVPFQDDLEREVPSVLDEFFNMKVSGDYDTLVAVAVLAVAFYGAGLAIDAVKKRSLTVFPVRSLKNLSSCWRRKLESRQPTFATSFTRASASHLIESAKGVFRPSQRDKNAPMVVDRDPIPSETIREISYPGGADKDTDSDRYTPPKAVPLGGVGIWGIPKSSPV